MMGRISGKGKLTFEWKRADVMDVDNGDEERDELR